MAIASHAPNQLCRALQTVSWTALRLHAMVEQILPMRFPIKAL